jgi:hypothetical protein
MKMRQKNQKLHAKAQRHKESAMVRCQELFYATLCGLAPLRERSCLFGKSITINFTITLLGFSSLSFAANKPNFSGTWVLDKDRSFSNPPGLEQTMTITHNDDQIKLEGKQKTARGEIDLNESYTLDGKQTDYTPPNPPKAKGKRKASWLPNNKGILIEDEMTSTSPDGKEVTQQIARKWQLSIDGSTLTIDYYFDGPRGSFESKRVFVRKKE